MATYNVYSKEGAERRFATRTTVDALTNATIEHTHRIARLEAAHPGAAALTLAGLTVTPHATDPDLPLIGLLGDTWAGSAALARPLISMLQAGVVADGRAGTGWTAGATATPATNFAAPGRVDAMLDAHPRVLVVVGSYEDEKALDTSAITASVASLVSRVRNRAPALPIIIVGPQPTSEYRTYAGGSARNAQAVRAGATSPPATAANGVYFVDWLGTAERNATRWTGPGRQWHKGELISFDGVVYKVQAAMWAPSSTPEAPDPYQASLRLSDGPVPVSRVLTGSGAKGKAGATGRRALWLAANETTLDEVALGAFGARLAWDIATGLTELREWMIGRGPVIVGPYVEPPAPTPRPKGIALDLRDTKWGVSWGALSTQALNSAFSAAGSTPAPLATAGAGLPARKTSDDAFVASNPNTVNPGNLRINATPLATLTAVTGPNGKVAALSELLTGTLQGRGPIVLECFDTTTDTSAQYWNYDQALGKYVDAELRAAASERVLIASRPDLNAARAKAAADEKLKDITRLVDKTTSAWTGAAEVTACTNVGAFALRPADLPEAAELLAAIKGHPEKPGLWWAGVSTAQQVKDARAAASAAGVPIEGWLVDAAPAAAEVATKTQPEQ
jgi:hypothetical protein